MAVEPVDPDGPIESRKFFCHAFLLLREGTRKKRLGWRTLKGAMKWFDQWSSKRYGTVMVPMTDANVEHNRKCFTAFVMSMLRPLDACLPQRLIIAS